MDNNTAPELKNQPRRGRIGLIGGMVLIILGLLFLLQSYVPALDFSRLWPIILIVIGLGLLWDNFRRQ